MSTIGLSLDVLFRKQTYPSFPHFKSFFNWSSYNLKDLSINMFGDFRSAQIHRNIKAYIGSPEYTEEEIQAYLDKAIHGVYHINKDNNDKYDEATERKLADIRLFISPDGAFLLKAHHALKNNIKKDEIAVFLEIPDGDIVSGNVMLVAAGDNAKNYAEDILQHRWTQDQYALNDAQTKELISSLYSGQSLWDKIVAIAVKVNNAKEAVAIELGIETFSAIANLFGKTYRIEENKWNIDDDEYILNNKTVEFLKDNIQKIDNAIHQTLIIPDWVKNIIAIPIEIINDFIVVLENTEQSIQNSWAFICGVWNGVMDFISGVFALIELLFKAIKVHKKFRENENYYKALALEYYDNFLQAFLQVNWISVFNNSRKRYQEFKNYIDDTITEEILKEYFTFNSTELSYYSGYISINIVEFILPPLKLSRLAKAGKMDSIITEMDSFVAKALPKEFPVVKTSDEVVGAFFRTIEQGTEVIKGGTKNVNKLTDEVFDALKKQVDETIEAVVSKRKKILDDVETGKTKLDEDANGNKRKKGDETRTSNYAELKIDDYFETQTFTIGKNKGTLKRISNNAVSTLDDTIVKGIDGIYEFSSPPPKYIISEVKYNTATLSKTVTKSGGKQMSELWVDFDLRKGAVPAEIADDILIHGYEPVLCHVSKQGNVTVNTITQTLTEAVKGSAWGGKITP